MADSFYATQKISDLSVGTDFNESITNVFNRFSNLKYDYYHLTNDDFVYLTDGWDLEICSYMRSQNDWCIAYGNDSIANGNLCTAPIISRRILEVVGWLQLPTLKHLCGDCVWHYIGQRLGILKYFPRIIIQHNHFINNSAVVDDVYRKTNSQEMYRKDNEEFRRWIKEDSTLVLDNLRRAMNGS